MNLDRIIAIRNNKTVYRDGDFCIKAFGNGFCAADVLNEALNQVRAANTGLRVPRVLSVTVENDNLTVVSDYIRGKNLSELVSEKPEELSRYINIFVDLQIRMHNVKTMDFVRQKDKLTRRIEASTLPPRLIKELCTVIDVMPDGNSLCHGDFCLSNVILTERGAAYIVDWSHASIGDALIDAAKTYLILKLDGMEDAAEQYYKLYRDRRGISDILLRSRIPIAAASLYTVGNKREREFFIRFI